MGKTHIRCLQWCIQCRPYKQQFSILGDGGQLLKGKWEDSLRDAREATDKPEDPSGEDHKEEEEEEEE